MRKLQRVWDLLAGVLGVLILIAAITMDFEFEYGWIGYVAAVLMIGWGIRAIIIIINERKK